MSMIYTARILRGEGGRMGLLARCLNALIVACLPVNKVSAARHRIAGATSANPAGVFYVEGENSSQSVVTYFLRSCLSALIVACLPVLSADCVLAFWLARYT